MLTFVYFCVCTLKAMEKPESNSYYVNAYVGNKADSCNKAEKKHVSYILLYAGKTET